MMLFRCSGVPCSGVPLFRCSGVPGFTNSHYLCTRGKHRCILSAHARESFRAIANV